MILPDKLYAVLITHSGQIELDPHLFKNKEKALEYAKNRVKNLAGKHIAIETVTHTYWTTKSLNPTKKIIGYMADRGENAAIIHEYTNQDYK